jgi:hypothetical protein
VRGEVNRDYAVQVHVAGGGPIAGTVNIPLGALTLKTLEGRARMVSINDIAEISFLQWKGVRRGEKAWFFSPSLVSITMKEGSELRCSALSEFERFTLRSAQGHSVRHSCFYDYYERGMWRNARISGESYPESSPLEGTVVKILFIESQRGTVLEDVLRLFRQMR